MNKNRRYIFTFIFTLLIFSFLWMYNVKNQRVTELKNDLEKKQKEIEEVQYQLDACKGENFHKNKLLEMEKSKVNRMKSLSDSL